MACLLWGSPDSGFSAPGLCNHCLPPRDPSPPGHAPSPPGHGPSLTSLPVGPPPSQPLPKPRRPRFLPLALDLAAAGPIDETPYVGTQGRTNHVTRTRLLPTSPPEQHQDSPASFSSYCSLCFPLRWTRPLGHTAHAQAPVLPFHWPARRKEAGLLRSPSC